MPSPSEATDAVTDRLRAAGCVAALEEATELMIALPDATELEAGVQRRERGEPLAWITGTAAFCGRTIGVDAGVYVPRAQSEELARRAASLLPAGGRAIDLCTGAGAVAAHLLATDPTSWAVGIDADPWAAACARRNGVPVVVADLAEPIGRDADFDVVTAVAPYVPTGQLRLLSPDVQRWEPRLALDGGDDGLDLVRRVIEAAGRLLRPGGWLLVEVGGDQDRPLARTLAAAGFADVVRWWDEEGDLRGLAAVSR
ncbi:MAG: methyltransferase [Acidimicrobiales bacterium]|nr:methyltransferase [Acidimicrobiales bacterium]